MHNKIYTSVVIFTLAATLSSCGKEAEQATELTVQSTDSGNSLDDSSINRSNEIATSQGATDWNEANDLIVSVDGNASVAEMMSDSIIPYPVYPNGQKYRIGGENGLKVILFQTEDSFEDVDAFYQMKAGKEAGMPRLTAMNDYVRYSASDEDMDPWETSRPGIVIHQFNDESEREAVGASEGAKTNIIMSFE